MKNFLPICCLLAMASFALAAPEVPAITKKAPAPKVDPAAKRLLLESTRAYEALQGLSMGYANNDEIEGKTSKSNGIISISRPDKAKMTIVQGTDTLMFLTDGKKIYTQASKNLFEEAVLETDDDAISSVFENFPSSALAILPILVMGYDLITEADCDWESVTLLPDGKVQLKSVVTRSDPSVTVKLTFDPTDKLLRHIEATGLDEGKPVLLSTALTDIKLNPTFGPEEFAFKPGPDVKVRPVLPKFDPRLKVGTEPLPLKGLDLNGKAHLWTAYKGKVVLLDFWATWCGPCVEELPNVLGNYKKYHAKGFDVIGVSLDIDKKALTKFIAARGLKYPIIYDGKAWSSADAKSYGLMAIPFCLLIGKDGKIAAVDPTGEDLEPAIQAALAKP